MTSFWQTIQSHPSKAFYENSQRKISNRAHIWTCKVSKYLFSTCMAHIVCSKTQWPITIWYLVSLAQVMSTVRLQKQILWADHFIVQATVCLRRWKCKKKKSIFYNTGLGNGLELQHELPLLTMFWLNFLILNCQTEIIFLLPHASVVKKCQYKFIICNVLFIEGWVRLRFM